MLGKIEETVDMSQVIGLVGAVATGSLTTLVLKWRIDRRAERRSVRRALYVELVTLLAGRRHAVQRISFDTESAPPADIPTERVADLTARMQIDASPEVRTLSDRCFAQLNKFWCSYDRGTPIDTDEHGFFLYRFDLVRNKDEETRQLLMRVTLGEIADQFGETVDALAARVRSELNGRTAK